MNAMLTIQIRVASAQARQQIAAVGSQIKAAQAVANSGAGRMGPVQTMANKFGLTGTAAASFAGKVDGLGRALKTVGTKFPVWNKHIESMGKNMQWVGRQLEFNFTLPLVAAGYFATKWALDNERAMVQVRKVYGDLSFTQERVTSETNALAESFRLLSDRFGVNQKEVIDVAAAWASAGSAGRGLAENTRATLEAMIIGDMEATEATEALIAIMATYRISSKKSADGTSELGTALADLNIIENQTGIRFKGLVEVIQRAGGAAGSAGVDIRHLGAMAAALVPATGSATQAGNSLRTMISRLQAPTTQTIQILEKMGIAVMSEEWLGKNAIEKMEHMASAFGDMSEEARNALAANEEGIEVLTGLSRANQTLVSSVVASRWQVNRFTRLMEDIGSKTGYYQKALDATSDTAKENGDITQQQAAYWRELGIVLDSNPKKFEILANSLKNNLTTAIIPMIPVIMAVISSIQIMAEKFQNLDPQTRKYIVFGLAFLAITGPIVRLTGAWILLVAQLTKVFYHLGQAMVWIARNAAQGIIWMMTKLFGTLFGSSSIWATAWGKTESARVQATRLANTAIKIDGETTAVVLAATARQAGWSWIQAAYAAYIAWLSFYESMSLGAGAAASSAAGAQLMIPAVAAPAASTTVAIWTGASRAIAGQMALGTGAAAASQLALPAAAGTAAAGTMGIWSRMATALGTLWRATFQRLGIILMTALEGAVAAVATALSIPFWAAAALIAAAVAAIIVILDDDLRQNAIDIIMAIGRGINSLAGIFGRALQAVARVVAGWVMTIWDLLSYLNPFARHSPSLVDMVRAGVTTILDHYSSLKRIGPMLMGAVRAHEAFNAAIAATQAGFDATERGQQRADVAQVAPQALPAFDTMGGHIDALKGVLPLLTIEIERQAAVTALWQSRVDMLASALDHQTQILDSLKYQLDAVTASMDEAQSRLTELGNTDLPGMRAMEDQIFANEMAQKALRLELLRMEEAGQSVEDLRDRMSELQGFIELLSGQREDLRMAGAGSDILSVYDAEIEALEAQRDAMAEQGSVIEDIQNELEDLQRQAEILDLEKALAFDEPLRQIDQMIDGLNEMPFDEIVAEINKQKNVLTTLQPIYDDLTSKVKAQELVVERIRLQHEAANAALQVEQDKLTNLNNAYSDIEGKIREMESAMSDFAASSKQALADAQAAAEAAQSTVEDLFDAGLGADFEVPIGDDILDAEGMLADIEAFNAELQAELEKVMDEMGGVDIFGGIKEKFDGFIEWAKDWGRLLGPILGGILLFGLTGGWGLAAGALIGIIWKFGPQIWEALKGAWEWVKENLGPYLATFWDGVTAAWDAAWKAIGEAISWVWEEIIEPVFRAVAGFVTGVLVPIFVGLAAAVVWAWETVIGPIISWVWEEIIKPVFEFIWNFINGYLVPIFQVFAAVAEIVFTLIGRALKWLWDEVLFPIFNWIWNFVKDNLLPSFEDLRSTVETAFGIIGTVVMWAWNNFLYPVFSAIWGFLRDNLGPAFTWLWRDIIQPAWATIRVVIQQAWDAISPIFSGIDRVLRTVVGPAFTWLRDHVIAPVWEGIGKIVANAWNGMASILEGGVNFFISAFNLLASAVRTVASALSIKISIDDMKPIKLPRMSFSSGNYSGGNPNQSGFTMAAGGYVPPAPVGGFAGHHARAIVAEGSRMYDEYVIPTDPKYRNRATALYASLGNDLGMPPMMAKGGIIPDSVSNVIGGVGDFAGGIVGGAFDLVGGTAKKFWDIINGVKNVIKNITVGLVKPTAEWIKDKVIDWGVDKLKSKAQGIADFVLGSGGSMTDLLPGKGGETLGGNRAANRLLGQSLAYGRGWSGNQWTALDRLIMGESGWNNLAQNPTSTAFGIFQFLNSTWAGYGYAKTSDPYKQIQAGYNYISARYGNPANAYGKWLSRSPHWYEEGGILPPKLWQGGVVRGSTNGTLITAGDRNRDEAIIPLPHGFDLSGEGKKEYHFHGDLSFPNIKNPDDAEKFIRNLTDLAGVS